MKPLSSISFRILPSRRSILWCGIPRKLRWDTQSKKIVMGLEPSTAILASSSSYSTTSIFRSPSSLLSVGQIREKVLNAISSVGKPEEAKSLEDVQAHLPEDVKNAIRSVIKGADSDGGSGIAVFIYKYLKDEVQFLSEDNIQHSRIILRGKMPSFTPLKQQSPEKDFSQRISSTSSGLPLPPRPSFDTSGETNGGSSSLPTNRPRTMIETLERMVDYLPTNFVQSTEIASKLPKFIQELYADSNFIFFMKRFKHYVDIRTQHGYSELRLKQDFSHPRRGRGDHLYNAGCCTDSANRIDNSLRRPARNSEAHLISFLAPRIPSEYTPLATVLSDVSDIVARHPAFDPRLGVTGLLEKYPNYFQQRDGHVRSRPYRSAPFSLEDYDLETSPDKSIFSKLYDAIRSAAEGKNYAEDKASATISTGKLYALLTHAEKVKIKETFRSFPRFLRLHGKCVVVSSDSMKVYLFKPEYEPCAETLLDMRLRENQLSPDDPVLKIPATIADNVSIAWAVRELYDALPLTQCVELEDILTLVPPSVRSGLPAEIEDLQQLLSSYPEYFSVWAYPDNPSVRIIQRAKVETPEYTNDELVSLILPIIPDGGIASNTFVRRLPLALQRWFYKNGLRTALGKLTKYVQVTKDDRIIRIA